MKRPVQFVVICSLLAGALLGASVLFRRAPEPAPFAFPSRELAALDHDLQARFALVPEKDFGIERTYGNQHYLYDPQTPAELASVAALKRDKTEVAFYLMSRALWLRSWDGWGFKPIQGPVVLTGPISAPLPRIVNFTPPGDLQANTPIVDQDHGMGADSFRNPGLLSHNPQGTPVPVPPSPPHAPSYNRLQALGNRVFAGAESAPKTARIGIYEPINSDWKVVAVPIRASSSRCLPCHTYQPMGAQFKPPGRLKIDVGDALGVAFYLYKSQAPAPSP